MISYTKTNVSLISLVITMAICLSTSFVSLGTSSKQVAKTITIDCTNVKNVIAAVKKYSESEIESGKISYEINDGWQLEIPKINLKAPIAEGTEKEVMDNYIGHFTNTGVWDGNIGLAAHNRGYPVNYFENLKKLKENDEIVYQYMDFKERYVVKSNIIIKDTDWSYLEKTDRNTITLITCVENEPEYRRCVYGIKKEFNKK